MQNPQQNNQRMCANLNQQKDPINRVIQTHPRLQIQAYSNPITLQTQEKFPYKTKLSVSGR